MDTIKIMVNGLPGNVATTIARHALNDERFQVIPISFTGPDTTLLTQDIDGTTFKLVTPEQRKTGVAALKEQEGTFISIDYTHPTAVNDNVKFYCESDLPFVMGTTGGDRELIRTLVLESSTQAVIAPNMVKQIVGLQAMMEYAAKTFPGLFSGYSMNVAESHQSWKADTSGTAKAMIRYFNELGIPFTENDICMERDPEKQKKEWNIPEEHLDGHGWHTYTLDSPDKSARFAITHNISGRDIYAEGTLDGVVYLQGKLNKGLKGSVYSMIDVLKQA